VVAYGDLLVHDQAELQLRELRLTIDQVQTIRQKGKRTFVQGIAKVSLDAWEVKNGKDPEVRGSPLAGVILVMDRSCGILHRIAGSRASEPQPSRPRADQRQPALRKPAGERHEVQQPQERRLQAA
jgi:hypothetical protein